MDWYTKRCMKEGNSTLLGISFPTSQDKFKHLSMIEHADIGFCHPMTSITKSNRQLRRRIILSTSVRRHTAATIGNRRVSHAGIPWQSFSVVKKTLKHMPSLFLHSKPIAIRTQTQFCILSLEITPSLCKLLLRL